MFHFFFLFLQRRLCVRLSSSDALDKEVSVVAAERECPFQDREEDDGDVRWRFSMARTSESDLKNDLIYF